MRVENFLRYSARRWGDKLALVTRDMSLSFTDLDALSDHLAADLQIRGLRPGDRTMIFMDNCWEAVVAIFAVLKAGGVFSPVNPSTKADKLAFMLRNCRARAVITQARLAGVLEQALAEETNVEVAIISGDPGSLLPGASRFSDGIAGLARPVGHVGIDMDLAMLIYTSGSTGRPKGVMMTHRNIEAAATSITAYLRNTADDVILNVLPIAFDYGLYQILMAIKVGATIVLEKSFAFPQAIFDIMRREKVTGFPLVPTMAALILNMRDMVPGSLPALRYITNTAAALPPEHIERLRALFPDVMIFSMYGLTECKRCTWLPPSQLDVRPGSVGIAIPNTQAYVVDNQGRKVAHGVVGELVIRGPHVMQGYWENEEATAKVLRRGPNPWERVLYTGDLFRADADGFLYFVGRKDDIIKTRGEKVAPKEVEAAIHACPGVAEVVVFGRQDPILGQAIHAVVVAYDPSLNEQMVIRHCQRNLEDFMVPRSVSFRTELPKTDTGKVSRRLAAEEFEHSMELAE
ncbi:class I adenylate-forming enzyme family protein [Rhizobium rhizogenes]|uniref:class I adenylate-forming enzyme family protein n=1 Tax=Rhizobium rhizogenes TaxID=359 RepID=UPI0004D4948A|nr:AMP-binding protein [Rhizobium rhizogenes]KEA03403.1 AMP-dependent synthetase [Rhizobium rhizogenes]MQB32773.1 AMP-dependent synthetase [Rhizobium rhizogenes]NTF70562.1 AMP-binding protein [Rhizobium rhizogenes]NTH47097.1 AMP-binding protein [Rhizobium rhizogenes]NTH60444.1 AMP-binding protein [Rhizobium rhizogenes]